MDMNSVADAIDINAIMRQATRGAEKQSGLAPVFLKRDSFAGSAVSTGSLCIDRILGGGVPSGRIVGISGPERAGKTLLATQIGANQVSKHHFLKYMDAEGSTDPIFLAARGIDFDKYRGKRNSAGDLKPKEVDYVDFYQPSTVEQITNYIHTISGLLPENRNPTHPVCMYMLDSVVALITDDIDSNVIDSNKMSMHARAYATYLPIINSDLVKSGSTLIYTNQLRQKPGVKYGCLQGDSSIRFVDGRVFSIREVVDNKIEGEVWSYVGGKLVPAKITNWFDNGTSESSDWVQIKTEGPGSGNGFYSIIVTKNHKVLRSDGVWVEAQDIKLSDNLVTKYVKTIEDDSLAEQFLVGTLVGDSCVPKNQRNKDTLILTNSEQPEYLNWKVEKLKSVFDFNYFTINSKIGAYNQYVSKPDVCLGILTKDMSKRNPLSLLHKFTWLSVAVWFMDDGCSDFNDYHCRSSIAFARLRKLPEVQEMIKDWFCSRGINCKIAKDRRKLDFNKEDFLKLCDKIAEYIPPCMNYKLPPSHHGLYKDFSLEKGTEHIALPVRVLSLKEGIGHMCNRKFDIEVEGLHNYVAGHTRGGLVVHNSPLYEPCGDALKFFSSIRMMLSQTKPQLFDKDHPFLTKEVIPGVEVREGGVWEEPHVDKNGNIVGTDRYIYTGIKTVKNKIYTPYQKCWMRIQFEENGSTGHGLDPVFDIFTFLLDEGYIASGKNEKGKDVKGSYVARKCDQFDPIKELGIPSSFDYFEFKRWVSENKGLVSIIRDRLLVSGIVFSREDSVKIDYDIKKEAELEEQESEDVISELTSTIEQSHSVDDNLENVEKKKRGRKPKA